MESDDLVNSLFDDTKRMLTYVSDVKNIDNACDGPVSPLPPPAPCQEQRSLPRLEDCLNLVVGLYVGLLLYVSLVYLRHRLSSLDTLGGLGIHGRRRDNFVEGMFIVGVLQAESTSDGKLRATRERAAAAPVLTAVQDA